MKNLKKILSCVMAIATLGCMSSISAYAEFGVPLLKYDTIETSFVGNDIKNVEYTDDATLIMLNNGDTYSLPKGCVDGIFYNVAENKIDSTGEGNLVAYCVNVKVLNQDGEYYAILPSGNKIADINGISKVQAVYDLNNKYIGYRVDYMGGEDGSFSNVMSDSLTIGESENKPITEFTVGDSTFPRGDINLDGKVNTVDLLMLKKYLLGLMEW